MKNKKIIYVDIDGCICTTSYGNEDFKDRESKKWVDLIKTLRKQRQSKSCWKNI